MKTLQRLLSVALCLSLIASSWPSWALEERAPLPVEARGVALPAIALPSINAGLTVPSSAGGIPILAPAQATASIPEAASRPAPAALYTAS